jgi:spore maturation protein CgeB
MRIFIIQGAYGAVYEPAWFNALKSLGHQVELFNCHRFTSKGIIGKIERRFLIGPAMGKIRRESIKGAEQFRPDLILLYQGHYHNRESIKKLKAISWVTGYHNDNPFSATKDGRHYHRYKHLFKSLPLYDSFHVYRDQNVFDVKNLGVNNAKVLMSYFIPEIDYPFDEFNTSLGADVIFAGHPENDGREKYVNFLLDAGINIKIYGDGRFWKPLIDKKHWMVINEIKVLNVKDYRIAINSSKICLSFFSKWNRDTYTRRVFEIPALRRFLMTERTDTMMDLYKEGYEAEYFSNPEELLQKVLFYLNDDNKRLEIANNGYLRCLESGYDIESRMKQWIKDIQEWKKDIK